MRISDWSSDVCSSDLFVIAKDAARNRLIAAQDSEHALLMTRQIVTSAPFHWIGRPATPNEPLQARIRHRPALQDRTAETLADGREIGRASGRERVCQYGSTSVVAVSLNKQIHVITTLTAN